MDFKQEFLEALRSGQNHDLLLELVRRHHTHGLTAEESYAVLEQIWKDLGFDEPETTNSLRDELEYVMERVWYQGAKAG